MQSHRGAGQLAERLGGGFYPGRGWRPPIFHREIHHQYPVPGQGREFLEGVGGEETIQRLGEREEAGFLRDPNHPAISRERTVRRSNLPVSLYGNSGQKSKLSGVRDERKRSFTHC